MRRIELVTGVTGDMQHVAFVEIAPFPDRGMPDVVTWGVRCFRKLAVQPDGKPWRYVEAFAVASLTPSPGLTPEEPPPVDHSAITTLHGTPVDELRKQQAAQPTGQHADYIVLTDEERAKGFVRPVRRSYKHLKCGSVTTMGQKLAETYARDPAFYGQTMCCHCNGHFPVGAAGEFVWDGTAEKVGT